MTLSDTTPVSSPLSSIWVSASAGTGKTKILTDRVLSLMIQGINPKHILCLTYTNAAAQEMRDRIQYRLIQLVKMPFSERHEHLTALLKRAPSDAENNRVDTLALRMMDTPDDVLITTLHGFCNHVLQRFPIEAGLRPGLSVASDIQAIQIFTKAFEMALESLATGQPEVLKRLALWGAVPQLLAFTRAYLTIATTQLHTSYHQVLSPSWLHHATQYFHQCSIQIGPSFILEPHTVHTLCQLGKDVTLSLQSSVKEPDRVKATRLSAALEAFIIAPHLLERLTIFFLKKDGHIRKSLCSVDLARKHPDTLVKLEEMASLCEIGEEEKKQHTTARATLDLMTLTQETLRHYEILKQAHDQLDYQDLLEKTISLLSQNTAAAWVQYKLDQNFHHILMDEAQDTSPLQWRLVHHLVQEQMTGDGMLSKSLFVVGDAKQSIYSFQGAHVDAFHHYHQQFSEMTRASEKHWVDVVLDKSYRTTQSLLDCIDQICHKAMGIHHEETRHHSAKQETWGRFALYPLISASSSLEAQTSELPEDDLDPENANNGNEDPVASAPERTAQQIAFWIHTALQQKRWLPNKNRPLLAGDVLILVQQRGPVTRALYSWLRHYGVPVAAPDQLSFKKQLIVQDFIALAYWSLNPRDDLSLAQILKSPLGGLSEEDLMHLALERIPSAAEERRPLGSPLKTLTEILARQENPRFNTLYKKLCSAQKQARAFAPALFFEAVWAENRTAYINQLGTSCGEAIQLLIQRATLFQEKGAPQPGSADAEGVSQEIPHGGMQGFLHWFETTPNTKEKRAADPLSSPTVQIMTVHGAKGLQSPVVILADANRSPAVDSNFILPQEADVPLLWIPKASCQPRMVDPSLKTMQQQAWEESSRLLYVAMTRAEDELLVFGWASGRSKVTAKGFPTPGSWYSLITDALHIKNPDIQEDETGEQPRQLNTLPLWENIPEPTCPEPIHKPWEEREPTASVTPRATLLNTGPLLGLRSLPRASQVQPQKENFMAKAHGIWIHKLLHMLTSSQGQRGQEGDASDYKALAENLESLIPEPLRREVIHEVLNVLEHPDLAFLWENSQENPDYTEAPLEEIRNGERMSRRVDRLCFREDKILLIDFKTGKPSPLERAHPYITQLAEYYDLLKQQFTDKPIYGAILWTATAQLHMIEPKELEGVLETLPFLSAENGKDS